MTSIGTCRTCQFARLGRWAVARPGEGVTLVSYIRRGCPAGCEPGLNTFWQRRAAA
ncbi:MAG TPA: hypothetical protein VN429_05005 [Methanospirillum sp.]|uniref:hypothetical protein n=1 Tax=Methanospirillum sp. TaxID=45200 RepID=UPI002C6A62D9|nr:hypothetical protein [Methanospirillum sp.]HWQ63754.1 hypothetical protein [Methanospirillum sp.]